MRVIKMTDLYFLVVPKWIYGNLVSPVRLAIHH